MQGTVRTTNSEAKSDIGGIDLCGTKLVLWIVRVWITSTVGNPFLCEGKHTGFVDFKSWRVTEICLIKKGLQTLYFNTLGWRLSCSWQNHHSGRMFGRSTPNPSEELWLVLSSCFSAVSLQFLKYTCQCTSDDLKGETFKFTFRKNFSYQNRMYWNFAPKRKYTRSKFM